MTTPEPDLRDRLADALRTTPSVLMDTPEDRARHAANPRNHHVEHHYYWGCAMCRGEVDTLADAALGIVQHDLESLEQQAQNAAAVARQAHQRAESAESDLEAWDELRAQAHEDMRTGFAQAIRWKWDCELSDPDADSAADAVINYLENEYAGQLARAQAQLAALRDAARSAAVPLRATADRPSTRAVLLAAARDLDDIAKETT